MTSKVSTQEHHLSVDPTPCCCLPKDPYVKAAEVIAVLAIGAFALHSQPLIFVAAISLGAIYQFVKIKLNLSQSEDGSSKPGCGQGYGEFFSGIKFWPTEVVAVIALLAWEHLQMAPYFYVPFFGFFMGMRVMHLTYPLTSSLIG